jgi:transposase
MPKPYPAEIRRDVVDVTRRNEAPLSQIAKDFGISDASLHNWLNRADIEDGVKPGLTQRDSDQLRSSKKRIRLIEMENEVLRRAAAYLSQGSLPK